MRAHHKPFEVLTSNGIANEWVGWVTKPASLLSLEAAIVGSHGGAFGIGLSALPNGDLPTAELDVVADTSRFLAQRQHYFGPQTGVADVHFLIQPFRSHREYQPPEQPPPWPRLPRGGGHHVPPIDDREAIVNGLWDAAREAHFTTDLVHEHTLLQTEQPLAGVPLLVLSATAQLSTPLCDRIRDFVAAGGHLLAEGHASLLDETGQRRPDFALADVFGVHFRGYTGAWDANYLDLTGDPHTNTNATAAAAAPRSPTDCRLSPSTSPARRCTSRPHQTLPSWPASGHHSVANRPSTTTPPRSTTHHRLPLPPLSRTPTLPQPSSATATATVEPCTSASLSATTSRPDATSTPGPNTWSPTCYDCCCQTHCCALMLQPVVELVLNRTPDGRLLLHLLNHYVASDFVSHTTAAAPRLAPIQLELNETRLGTINNASAGPPHTTLVIDRRQPGWATLTLPSLHIHQTITIHTE